MLSQAGEVIGQGWAFGLHEALDQSGATIGPLIAAFVLAQRHDYHAAFAWLLVPAVMTLGIVFSVRLRYPAAGHIANSHSVPAQRTRDASRLPHEYWWYCAGAALVAFGFADFALISYHFTVAQTMPSVFVPVLYATAMATAGLGSFGAGRWYDRRGLIVLIPATLLIAGYAPAVFFGTKWIALIGTILWGLGVGFHETVMAAAVAHMVAPQRRARAYGIFTAIFGLAWFAGSAVLGALYDRSIIATVTVAALTQLLGIIPIGLAVKYGRLRRKT